MAARGPREREAITLAVRRRSISSWHGATTASRVDVLRPVVTLLAQTLRAQPTPGATDVEHQLVREHSTVAAAHGL